MSERIAPVLTTKAGRRLIARIAYREGRAYGLTRRRSLRNAWFAYSRLTSSDYA